MASDSYLHYHRQLLIDLRHNIVQQPPFDSEQPTEADEQFLRTLDQVCENPSATDEGPHPGQQIIGAIVARYPHVTPMVPRDLFWFFGGDCLHFLGDDEIARFQQLDEDYHRLQSEDPGRADYAKLRASISVAPSRQLN